MIEGYTQIREIGRGGMATVYLANQTSLNRQVALKILRSGVVFDKEYIKRFFREARITAQLDHPNIIRIYESNYSQADGVFYIVTEYVEGGDFQEFLSTSSGSSLIGLREKLEILLGVISALDYAHQKGVVHRDVKPSNILLTKKREPKLCDFGIATALWGQESRFTQTHESFGTADYIAPEQKESSKFVDLRADIYSIGVILYQLITGQKPQGAFPPPIRLYPSIPVKLNDIVMKCLQPLPVDRFKSAFNLFREIRDVLDETPDEFAPSKLIPAIDIKPESTERLKKDNTSDHTQVDTRSSQFYRMVETLKNGTISEKISVKSRFMERIDPFHEKALIQLLIDPATEGLLKETVIEALGKLKSKESCPYLIELLSDPYYNKMAAAAIGETGCIEAEEKLFNILLSHSEKSYIALLPLGKLNSVKSVDLIAEYLTDRHSWIREMALDALGMINHRKIIDYLERISNRDPDANIRAKSKKILWRLKK